MQGFYLSLLSFGLLITLCSCQVEIDTIEDAKKFLEDTLKPGDGDSEGVLKYLKLAAGSAKESAESGVESMKDFADQAKEKSEAGADVMKGFLGGIGDRFNKAKEVFEDGGTKIKEAFVNAAGKSKEEFGSATDKASKHTKEMSEMMSGLFG